MSSSGSSPATSRTRRAITSVPDPGEPTDTRLPRRSSTDSMPLPLTVATWVRLLYSRARAWAWTCSPSKVSVPLTASAAVSARAKARSLLPSAIRYMLSTEAEVTSAVAA
jgi:hypothetical protein